MIPNLNGVASELTTDDESQSIIADLQRRLAESEDTLEAIRRGDIDALVVGSSSAEHRVYTLESADRPYRVLIEQIQEGAVTLSVDGAVLYCNRRLSEMLGVPQERLIGQSLAFYLAPAEQDGFPGLLARASQQVLRVELVLRSSSGDPWPAYLSLSPLESDSGESLLCGVLSDLTQQKRVLRELSSANERLVAEIRQRELVEEALRQSQKMEAVGQLTGGLAHDFNNLLTGIMGSLQLMRKRVAQGRPEEVERFVDAALASADRAAALTHRLLAFSRRQTLDPKLVDPNHLIAGMEELIRQTVGPGVEFEVQVDGEVGTTLCDPHQLENAILNLAINARDAMPDGGRLVISTQHTVLESDFAAFRDMVPGRYTAIAVTDTGSGMSAETAARAFDPFFTTKPIGMGTGLGLSMIYGFAKQSGGQVRIHSRPGLGTTVRLYLPRQDSAAETETETADIPDLLRARLGETVLVIDDEATVRMLVVEVLRELGYAALEAHDGPSGLRELDGDHRIDLLVTDVGLPGGMNGRQVADAARTRRPGLKVLFITGFAESMVFGNRPIEEGMEVITKPFAIETLAARIQALIQV